MKLLSLELCNFRQFYNEQVLTFGTDESKNVTVIHGENGSGKTALLNAFKWVLYDEVDFDTGKKHLVNEHAIHEASLNDEIHSYVLLSFEHDDLEYKIRRELFCKKDGDLSCSPIGGSVLELTWIGADGAHHKSPNPDTYINQILPKKLHSYFFFNGERIEKLATLEASSEIKRAIKSIMGLEIIERASRHIGMQVLKKLNKKLRENSTKEQGELLEKKSSLQDNILETEESINTFNDNVRHFKTVLKDINKKLHEISEISELQKERESLEGEIKQWREKITNIKRERMQYLSRYGFVAFTDKIINDASAILEEKRKKGELPSLIKSQFVDDLLESEKCICGREIKEGTEPHKLVSSYKKNATTDDVEDAFIKTSGAVSAMSETKKEVYARIQSYQKQIHEYENEVKTRNGRLDSISDKLKGHEIEDISQLEDKRDETQKDIDDQTKKIGAYTDRLNRYITELDELDKKIKELDIKDAQGKIVKSRIDLAEEVKRIIDELHLSLSEKVRADLSKRVNDTFISIIRKPYWAEISKDYTLEIYKKVGDTKHQVYDKSTGESQIASLSFIGSLIAIAKERQEESAEYYKGGIYPIVMDSPYGSLDPEYGGKVAEAIPSLAKQVILMATNKQWKGNVSDSVSRRASKEYTLMYHTTESKTDSETTSVVINSEYEYSEIREGYYE